MAFFDRLFGPSGKKAPKGLLYTKTHEWVEEPTNEIEKEEVRCGITDAASRDRVHLFTGKRRRRAVANDTLVYQPR